MRRSPSVSATAVSAVTELLIGLPLPTDHLSIININEVSFTRVTRVTAILGFVFTCRRAEED